MSTASLLELISTSPEQTREIGRRIGELLCVGDLLLLFGELGAGKTTLVQGIASGCGETHVASPTFALCHLYETKPPIADVDCWRIASDDQLDDLGLDEAIEDGVVIVEWPRPEHEIRARATLRVRLFEPGSGIDDVTEKDFGITDNAMVTRRIDLETESSFWSDRLRELEVNLRTTGSTSIGKYESSRD